MNTHTPLFFVSSAVVAGQLTTVMDIAREISLAAKNAKAIAERAGDKANSFKPITDYIDEMGRETIHLVGLITEQSLLVSRRTVSLLRTHDASLRFKRAVDLLAGSDQAEPVKRRLQETNDEVVTQQKVLAKDVNDLLGLLERISSCMRASGVISTRSRVEAAHAGDYEESLISVATTIETASERIKSIIESCESRLRHSREYEMKVIS